MGSRTWRIAATIDFCFLLCSVHVRSYAPSHLRHSPRRLPARTPLVRPVKPSPQGSYDTVFTEFKIYKPHPPPASGINESPCVPSPPPSAKRANGTRRCVSAAAASVLVISAAGGLDQRRRVPHSFELAICKKVWLERLHRQGRKHLRHWISRL